MNNQDRIKAIQKHLGGIKVDGIAGTQTWTAIYNDYFGSESTDKVEWPKWSSAKEVDAFFGQPLKLVKITPPYALRIFYDGKWKQFKILTCNEKVAPSLMRILTAIKNYYKGDPAKIKAAGMDVCEGVWVDRQVIGGSRKSMHFYGAAIDFNAENNPLGSSTNKMPKAVIDIFKKEGWRWGGDYTGRKDAMHFEACR